MNLTEKILKLTTFAMGLRSKTLRLHGEEFTIGLAAVTNTGGPRENLPMLMLELLLPGDGPEVKPDCKCVACETAGALEGKFAFMVTKLLTTGCTDKLVLDSCGFADNSFTAKVRNTATRRCDVGEGRTMILAVAHATAKASRE